MCLAAAAAAVAAAVAASSAVAVAAASSVVGVAAADCSAVGVPAGVDHVRFPHLAHPPSPPSLLTYTWYLLHTYILTLSSAGGPAGCGCSVGCTSPEPPGEGSCDGPDCEEPGEEDCTGDDCECEPTKTVTSCGVLCIETVAPTTTMTGICSTTTCQTTSCGQDTTVTSTSTTTIEEDFTVTVVATDPVWTEDNTAAYATSIYNDVLSWWSMEDAAAAATSTSTTSQQPTTTTPPVNIYTSAIAIAAYTTCVGEADGECAWQFELYTVSPPGLSPSSFSVDGCNAGDAIYTSVVDYLPTTTDIPKLGPFDMNGLTGCYIEDLDGPFGCVDPDATYCTYCLNSDDEQTCGSTGACNEDETASYGTLQICQWA